MQKEIYTRTAIVLHWLIGICVLAQITLGLWMITIPKSPPGVRAAKGAPLSLRIASGMPYSPNAASKIACTRSVLVFSTDWQRSR